MGIETTKLIAKEAISTIDGALAEQPTGLSRLLLGYAPYIRKFLIKGRVRLSLLKQHENEVAVLEKSILKLKTELHEELKNENLNIDRRIRIEKLEKEYRILNTVQKSLEYINEADENIEDNATEDESATKALWWDLFEDLASRRNEPWRTELFAKSLAENDKEPNAISLKSLWEIAMMETEDFGALKIFLDSSIFLDGKAFVLMEPMEQYGFEPDLNEYQSGNLALCITGLIDKGLIQNASTQMMTTEPVEIEHQSGLTYLIHELEGITEEEQTAIRLDGYSATDCCLDICRLYSPEFNIASERNFEILQEILHDSENQNNNESDNPKCTYSFVKNL